MRRSFLYVEELKEMRHGIQRAVDRMTITADPSGLADELFRQYVAPIIEHHNPIVSSLASHYGDNLFRARKCVDGTAYSNIGTFLILQYFLVVPLLPSHVQFYMLLRAAKPAK
jgi:hypothetical protein